MSLSALTLLPSLGCNNAGGQGTGTRGDLSGPPVMLPDYQTRAARTCTKLTTPPSLAQAVALVQCEMDGIASGALYLTQNVKIEMGAPRPFVYQSDAGTSGIDLKAQVYPLRGSYTSYMCYKVGAGGYPAGKGCMKSDVPLAAGTCWKTAFGDWHCSLKGASPSMGGGMPAPPVSY
jgi:hypothetical protein